MIEKIEKGITDEKALLAILVARANDLIEVANRAEKVSRSQQPSWD